MPPSSPPGAVGLGPGGYLHDEEVGNVDPAPLVVLSHLRWTGVWQRPQQLVSRLARHRPTWFVEGPLRVGDAGPRLRDEDVGGVRRVWLEVPGEPGEVPPEESGPVWATYVEPLQELLGDAATGSDVWIYTPMALVVARALRPRLLVYDVMDDLAAFADGGPRLRVLQREALEAADLVFAGGRSLHGVATAVRGPERTHLFPSGVDTRHYAASRLLRRSRPEGRRPVAGYVGVLDERLDLRVLADMAAALPDWTVELVGPVTKIDPRSLPAGPNLRYRGSRPYERLPEVMAGFDVALMPFALNEATRKISPTKTLEYLAAGLPVVSTRVPDVVADWGEVVRFADTGAGFAAACRAVLAEPVEERDARLAPLLGRYEWDRISAEMARLLGAG
jgi:glycosyltransferase involved in cell wall biosynthesis